MFKCQNCGLDTLKHPHTHVTHTSEFICPVCKLPKLASESVEEAVWVAFGEAVCSKTCYINAYQLFGGDPWTLVAPVGLLHSRTSSTALVGAGNSIRQRRRKMNLFRCPRCQTPITKTTCPGCDLSIPQYVVDYLALPTDTEIVFRGVNYGTLENFHVPP